MDNYRMLLANLIAHDANIVPVSDITSTDEPRPIALRFDIDNAPEKAVEVARINSTYGIPGSFYFLHTHPYFHHPHMLKWVSMIRDYGGEIGLHTDPYTCYARGNDGAEEVKKGLDHLRKLGATITGTCAHGSYPVYKAEAFEIFKQFKPMKDMCKYPTGILDMHSLGLVHEANHPMMIEPTDDLSKYLELVNSTESPEWMFYYLADNPTFKHQYDVSVWYHFDNTWTLTCGSVMTWKIRLNLLITIINKLPNDFRIVFTIHPEFFTMD